MYVDRNPALNQSEEKSITGFGSRVQLQARGCTGLNAVTVWLLCMANVEHCPFHQA